MPFSKLLNLFKRNKIDQKHEFNEKLLNLNPEKMPRHIAIIMDGNGRWARKKGLPRAAGHQAGVEALRKIIQQAHELKIEIMTFYAFSTENWKRPPEEVDFLMNLLVKYLRQEIKQFRENNIKLNFLGRIDQLPHDAREEANLAAEATKNNTGMIVNIALNYGGRAEITDAVKKIAEKVKNGMIDIGAINEKLIGDHLYTAGMPDPDLLIRSSGEMRLSNYLLWQVAYAEIWVTPTFWPDFERKHLLQAIYDFQQRERRFGTIKK